MGFHNDYSLLVTGGFDAEPLAWHTGQNSKPLFLSDRPCHSGPIMSIHCVAGTPQVWPALRLKGWRYPSPRFPNHRNR